MSRSLRQRLLTSVTYASLAGTALFAQACLDRPIAKSDPRTSNTVTEKVKLSAVDKIDLLFVIDNSASMADKQAILALAVPDLVSRLVTPQCVVTDAMGKVTAAMDQTKNPDGSCKQVGAAPEFEAVKDIHIGVVSSSLGGHGANTCEPGQTNYNPSNNDHARLVARKPGTAKDANPAKVPTYMGKDFFFWDPANKGGGETNVTNLVTNFTDVVKGIDQVGCGYEATLESWYRFLVEPNPPGAVEFANPAGAAASPGVTIANVTGTDTTLLQQRADFLRPDSLVAIITLSDENDCSMVDGRLPNAFCDDPPAADENGVIPGGLDDAGNPTDCKSGLISSWDNGSWNDDQKKRFAPYGIKRAVAAGATFKSNYLGAVSSGGFRMRPGTAACADNPNSPDCKSCYEGGAAGDASCSAAPNGLDVKDDGVSMRCYEQKRRFGVDMLYPTEKYVRALYEDTVYDRNGYRVANPLFQDLPYERKLVTRPKLASRSKNFVFFAGIVGVPWQDLAKQADAKDPKSVDLSLGYKSGSEVDWDLVVGNPRGEGEIGKPETSFAKAPVEPKDPLMKESLSPRTGMHPITGETIGEGQWNTINGNDHLPEKEMSSTAAKDIMFACIFPLLKPQDCTKEACADCEGGSTSLKDTKNPLCAPPKADGTGTFGVVSDTQYRAKAYPGTRFLEVMRYYAQLNSGGVIPASICARNVTDNTKPDYGYRPAVSSIVDALKVQLAGKCLPRQLDPAEDGTTPCLIIDAQYKKAAAGATANDPNEVNTCKQCVGENNSRKKIDPKTEALIRSAGGEIASYECLCEVTQLTAKADVSECRTVPGTLSSLSSGNGGWCYVDPSAKGLTDAEIAAADQIVSKCPATQKHTIRFVAADTTNKDLFITCLGAASGTTEIKKLRSLGRC